MLPLALLLAPPTPALEAGSLDADRVVRAWADATAGTDALRVEFVRHTRDHSFKTVRVEAGTVHVSGPDEVRFNIRPAPQARPMAPADYSRVPAGPPRTWWWRGGTLTTINDAAKTATRLPAPPRLRVLNSEISFAPDRLLPFLPGRPFPAAHDRFAFRTLGVTGDAIVLRATPRERDDRENYERIDLRLRRPDLRLLAVRHTEAGGMSDVTFVFGPPDLAAGPVPAPDLSGYDVREPID